MNYQNETLPEGPRKVGSTKIEEYSLRMNRIKTIVKPPWRTLSACIVLVIIFLLGYQLWTPGKVVRDGSHDLKTNGIWMQHGWLGDDKWFKRYKKNLRNSARPKKLFS